jgi:hypothetical protein
VGKDNQASEQRVSGEDSRRDDEEVAFNIRLQKLIRLKAASDGGHGTEKNKTSKAEKI